jgi:uncharacterized protein (TIGR00106 family)
MVLMEMSISPLGAGESVSAEVAKCIDIVDRSGLQYELHSMGTIVEGELADVLALLRQCVEAVASDHHRVSASVKLDYREGPGGRLESKITSVEQKLGRPVRK